MPTFTHEVSENGLALTTRYDSPEEGISGTINITWLTVEEANANIEKAKHSNEQRLLHLAGRNETASVKRKRVGPLTLFLSRAQGSYDTWSLRLGNLAIEPTGITRQTGPSKLAVGFGTRHRGYAIGIERPKQEATAAEPAKPRITREDIAVPIQNPFRSGQSVIIPAGSVIYDKHGRNPQTTDRKRTVKPWRTGDGHFSVEKLSPGNHRSGLIGTILAHQPYIVWGQKEMRTEVTPALLEANGLPVTYAETEYQNFAAYIESGDYELKGMTP